MVKIGQLPGGLICHVLCSGKCFLKSNKRLWRYVNQHLRPIHNGQIRLAFIGRKLGVIHNGSERKEKCGAVRRTERDEDG